MPNEENLHQRDGVQLNDLNAEGGLPEGQQMNDLRWLNGDYGYPFPMGPLIPLPNLKHPPLWPGLLKKDLNRPEAAAQVVYEVYRNRVNDEDPIRKGKETLGALMDTAFNNFLKHADPEMKLQGAEPALGLLEEWKGKIKNNIERNCFSDLLGSRLESNIRGLHKRGRPPLVFSMDYYPAIGDKFDFNNSRGVRVNGWPKCYGQETQEHMSGLLDKPDGIWTVMALLFNKLLHAHMGWLVPDGIWADRRELYYTHVLRLLERCARQVVEAEAHPLAGTAAAIWMNFRRMKGLIVVDEKAPVIDSQDEKAPVIDPQDEKAPVIDPRDKNLPDSLHMDSAMWVDRSLGEVREIFQWWMENNGGERNELKEVEGLMQDVSFLAWEVASYYTDPFAIGGLGIELPSIQVVIEDTRERVGEVAESKQNDGASGEKKKAKKKGVEKFASDHENARKGLAILKNFSDYDNLSRKKREKLNHLPQRFRECRIVDLDIWLVRLAQLKVCYEKIHQMLSKYGLDKFQARQGEGQ